MGRREGPPQAAPAGGRAAEARTEHPERRVLVPRRRQLCLRPRARTAKVVHTNLSFLYEQTSNASYLSRRQVGLFGERTTGGSPVGGSRLEPGGPFHPPFPSGDAAAGRAALGRRWARRRSSITAGLEAPGHPLPSAHPAIHAAHVREDHRGSPGRGPGRGGRTWCWAAEHLRAARPPPPSSSGGDAPPPPTRWGGE